MRQRSIDDWQTTLSAFYGRADASRETGQPFLSLIAEIGEISRFVISGERAGLSSAFAQAVSWVFGICSRQGLSLSQAWWTTYALGCPLCLCSPCCCSALPVSTGNNLPPYRAEKRAPIRDSSSISLRESQRLVLHIYPTFVNSTSVEHLLLRLGSAAAEAYTLLERKPDDFPSVIITVFTHLLMAAAKLRVDIDRAIYNLYATDQVASPPLTEVTRGAFVDDRHSSLLDLWHTCCTSDIHEKGRTLEQFASAFFGTVPAFRVRHDVRTDTSQFDLIICIQPEAPGGLYWERYQPIIFVECKNTAAPAGQNVVSTMLGKTAVHAPGNLTSLVFLVSASDFSKEAVQQLRYAYLKGCLIVPITGADIEDVLQQGSNIEAFLRELVDLTCIRAKSVIV